MVNHTNISFRLLRKKKRKTAFFAYLGLFSPPFNKIFKNYIFIAFLILGFTLEYIY